MATKDIYIEQIKKDTQGTETVQETAHYDMIMKDRLNILSQIYGDEYGQNEVDQVFKRMKEENRDQVSKEDLEGLGVNQRLSQMENNIHQPGSQQLNESIQLSQLSKLKRKIDMGELSMAVSERKEKALELAGKLTSERTQLHQALVDLNDLRLSSESITSASTPTPRAQSSTEIPTEQLESTKQFLTFIKNNPEGLPAELLSEINEITIL